MKIYTGTDIVEVSRIKKANREVWREFLRYSVYEKRARIL